MRSCPSRTSRGSVEVSVLTVCRWQAEGYLNVLTATSEETIKAEPFEAVELRLGSLFGDD